MYLNYQYLKDDNNEIFCLYCIFCLYISNLFKLLYLSFNFQYLFRVNLLQKKSGKVKVIKKGDDVTVFPCLTRGTNCYKIRLFP